MRTWLGPDGTSTWHVEQGGPRTTWSSPAMTASSGSFEIASLTQ